MLEAPGLKLISPFLSERSSSFLSQMSCFATVLTASVLAVLRSLRSICAGVEVISPSFLSPNPAKEYLPSACIGRGLIPFPLHLCISTAREKLRSSSRLSFACFTALSKSTALPATKSVHSTRHIELMLSAVLLVREERSSVAQSAKVSFSSQHPEKAWPLINTISG